MSEQRCAATPVDEDDETVESHLEELPEGAGCVGIWEYLSDKREAADDD